MFSTPPLWPRQMPCMSGVPSGVRGGVNVCRLSRARTHERQRGPEDSHPVAVRAPRPCPASGAALNATLATNRPAQECARVHRRKIDFAMTAWMPLRAIDDLRHAQVHRDCWRAGRPRLAASPFISTIQSSISRVAIFTASFEILVEPHRRILGGRLGARQLDGLAFVQDDLDFALERGLDGGSADLAMPLGSVAVAERQQRAGNEYREIERRARDEIAVIHVGAPRGPAADP